MTARAREPFAASLLLLLCAFVVATRPSAAQSGPPAHSTAVAEGARELQTGSNLTRQGLLVQALPHLLAARRLGADPYATAVDLAICYLGTLQYRQAVAVLEPLHEAGARAATVGDLLAQAWLGAGDPRAAVAFRKAAAATPGDEKLYAYMADACTDHRNYTLGLEVVGLGLEQLPNSARLHYERALFLARLGRFEEGKPEFERAARLSPGSYIGYLALVQENLYEDNLAAATQLLHQAIAAGHRDYRMLSLLGTVLLHEGTAPGEPKFAEAQAALEESAQDRPDYSATQIALGKVYLMLGRDRDAIEHLETGRRLEPDNPAIYPSLAEAFGHLGEREKARAARAELSRLMARRNPAPDPSQP
jgi:tetratricopeptide (TPR) repeat protein